jgi:hypothetical protein
VYLDLGCLAKQYVASIEIKEDKTGELAKMSQQKGTELEAPTLIKDSVEISGHVLMVRQRCKIDHEH